MVLTPSLVVNVETRMKRVSDDSYKARLANLWWRNVAIDDTTTGGKTILTWLLDTARIGEMNDGEWSHEDMFAIKHEYEVKFAGNGFKMNKTEFDDDDTSELAYRAAAAWAAQTGVQFAYWPQRLISYVLKYGASDAKIKSYDNLQFFANNHPVNPLRSEFGTYANLFTGAASGSYPGALPIDESVSVDVALANLAKLRAYVAGILSTNGVDPRNLVFDKLIVPPRLYPRANLLLNAEVVASTAAGGAGGSTDMRAYVKTLQGLGQPIEATELGANMPGGSDTSYYVSLKYQDAVVTDLAALMYVVREPFSIRYHGLMDDAKLQRVNEMQWASRGRNVVAMGHPFLLLKINAT